MHTTTLVLATIALSLFSIGELLRSLGLEKVWLRLLALLINVPTTGALWVVLISAWRG